jgi:hypothetical protein
MGRVVIREVFFSLGYFAGVHKYVPLPVTLPQDLEVTQE